VSITVNPVNDAPVAYNDVASTLEDTSVTKDVVANDTDVDNANAALHVVTGSLVATHGTATLGVDGRTIQFTPDLNANDGNVSGTGFTVTYRITDGDLTSNTATLTVPVTAVNDAPVVHLSGDSAASEGSTHSYTYTVTDVDDSSAAVTEDCGDHGQRIDTPASNSFDCTFPDGPASSTVSVTADDGHAQNNLGPAQIMVSVANVSPAVVAPVMTLDSVTGNLHLAAAFSDPGTDTFIGSFAVTIVKGAITEARTVTGAVSGTHSAGTLAGDTPLAPGCYTLIATATVRDDDGGSNTSPVSNSGTSDVYSLKFQDPIQDGVRNIAKYGNVVPVKVIIYSSCVSGRTITTPNLFVKVVDGALDGDNTDITNPLTDSVSAADTDQQMRLTGSTYMYNLSTKSLTQNKDYTVRIKLVSTTGPTLISALLQPKK
jgi:hypothetical protein